MSEQGTALASHSTAALVERVVIGGDLKDLSPEQRVSYYRQVCDSVGLNPLTRPFEYLTLKGKLTLYAKRDATDQLRRIHNVSVTIVARERVDDVYVVTARATVPSGRTDESIGAVYLGGAKGEDLANSLMKAETKSKRRVTLSICGLGMLDETEIETIPYERLATVSPVPNGNGSTPEAQPAVQDDLKAAITAWSERAGKDTKTLMVEALGAAGIPVEGFKFERLTPDQTECLIQYAHAQSPPTSGDAEAELTF